MNWSLFLLFSLLQLVCIKYAHPHTNTLLPCSCFSTVPFYFTGAEKRSFLTHSLSDWLTEWLMCFHSELPLYCASVLRTRKETNVLDWKVWKKKKKNTKRHCVQAEHVKCGDFPRFFCCGREKRIQTVPTAFFFSDSHSEKTTGSHDLSPPYLPGIAKILLPPFALFSLSPFPYCEGNLKWP